MPAILATRTLRRGCFELRLNPLLALCLLAAVAGLLRLGFWQLDRAGEKIRQQADYEALRESAAQPIESLAFQGLSRDRDQLQSRPVLLQGEYLNEQSVFLIFQSFEGYPGFEVVTPLRLSSGQGVVLVSRGWSGITDADELASRLPEVEGPVRVRGQLHVPRDAMAAQRNPPRLGAAQWPLLLRYLQPGELAPLFDEGLFPYVVRLSEGEPGVLVRHWPVVQVDTERHFSYALQWFAMAIALVAASLILASNLSQWWRMRAEARSRAGT